jgi:hypothetical protein
MSTFLSLIFIAFRLYISSSTQVLPTGEPGSIATTVCAISVTVPVTERSVARQFTKQIAILYRPSPAPTAALNKLPSLILARSNTEILTSIAPRVLPTPRIILPPRVLPTPRIILPPRVLPTPRIILPPRVLPTPNYNGPGLTIPTPRVVRPPLPVGPWSWIQRPWSWMDYWWILSIIAVVQVIKAVLRHF